MRPVTAFALAVAVALDAQHAPAQKEGSALPSPIESAASPVKPSRRWGDQERPAPPDVVVTLTQDGNALHVAVKRSGYVVALHAGERVSVAEDWVSALVEGLDRRVLEMEWEATEPQSLDTVRGGLRITPAAETPTVSWFALPEPVVVASRQDRLHTCRTQVGESGYTVLCRVSKSARKLSVTNVTDDSLLSNVWMSSGAAHVVRLDLPLSEGEAPARLMGYIDGVTAVVVRAEASWARGEEHPTMGLFAATRRQPVVARFGSW